jgi:hypothetical protein
MDDYSIVNSILLKLFMGDFEFADDIFTVRTRDGDLNGDKVGISEWIHAKERINRSCLDERFSW